MNPSIEESTINHFISECHKTSKDHGFWNAEPNVGEKLMLMVTELSEACEAARLGDWENLTEELVDCVIRIFDFVGYYNLPFYHELDAKMHRNQTRPYKHGKEF